MSVRFGWLTACILLFTCIHPIYAADIVDRVVAVVNDDVITLSEVNQEGKALFKRIAEQVPPDRLEEALQQARQNVIEELIDKKILQQEARKYDLKVTDEEVDRALQRILERNNTTMEQFRSELAAVGMDEQQYRENLRSQILSSKLVNMEVRSKVIIPEEKIIDYYDTHYMERMGDGGYYLLQIGINVDPNDPDPERARAEARKKAEQIREQALAGEDFKELARKYSDLPSAADGGDIGVFKADEMAPAMREAVISLKPGEISELVETSSGFQIFKLLSSKQGQIVAKVPYDEVKEEIRNILYQQETKELFDNWLKKMRENAYIKIL
ncbi:peptidylprolyl isomerase [Desulfolithobacter dissulfuricans]|uniref:Peptidylprolyl isomerase n=1 Tax=Desulfolithobacter dissulfuricans TaxID=2795293 RepID=A0A915U2C4_9BACT|nr:peptidylprolyl isomerase [Desulfolithobacter dissulfuricans]BCO10066.1 peptidylprolyl isomerase [Desulfolithobacter dissulfuricans]